MAFWNKKPPLENNNDEPVVVATNTDIGNTDNDKTLSKLRKATDLIDKMDQSTLKANDDLAKYTQSYRELNKELDTLIDKTRGIKLPKFRAGSRSSSSSSRSNSSNESASREAVKIHNDIRREQNNSSKTIKNMQTAANKFLSGTSIASLGPIMAASSGITALAVSLNILAKEAANTENRMSNYARSLKQMGIELDSAGRRALEYANTSNKLDNQVSELKNDIGNFLVGFKSGLSDILTWLGYQGAQMPDVVANAQSSATISARSQGFSGQSSRNIAGTLMGLSNLIGPTWGMQPTEVMEMLTSAVFTGSGAEGLGINVSDTVLKGWAAENGKDLVNVEVTDAMKSYYRFILLQEQASADVDDDMASNIKRWQQLGFEIDKCKNKLFSFDEVIQLAAIDSEIPEVNGNSILNADALEEVGKDKDGKDKGQNKRANVQKHFREDVDNLSKTEDKFSDDVDKLKSDSDDTVDKASEKLNDINNKFDTSIDKLNGVIEKFDLIAEKMNLAADKTNLAADKMNTAAGEMSDAADENSSAAETMNTAAETNKIASDAAISAAEGFAGTIYEFSDAIGEFEVHVDNFGNIVAILDEAGNKVLDASGQFDSAADNIVNAAMVLEKAGPEIKAAMEEGGEHAGEKIRNAIESAKVDLTVTNKTIIRHVDENGNEISATANIGNNTSEDVKVVTSEVADEVTSEQVAEFLRNVGEVDTGDALKAAAGEVKAPTLGNVMGQTSSRGEFADHTDSYTMSDVTGHVDTNSLEQQKEQQDLKKKSQKEVDDAKAKVERVAGEMKAEGGQAADIGDSMLIDASNLRVDAMGNITGPIDFLLEVVDFWDGLHESPGGPWRKDINVASVLKDLGMFALSTITFPAKTVFNSAYYAGENYGGVVFPTLYALASGFEGIAFETVGDIVNATAWALSGLFGYGSDATMTSLIMKQLTDYLTEQFVNGRGPEAFNNLMAGEDDPKYWSELGNIKFFLPETTYVNGQPVHNPNKLSVYKAVKSDYELKEGEQFYDNKPLADGGIGTKELHGASLFEGNKAEAVIPLESDMGIRYLSDAMREASGGEGMGNQIVVNLTLRGLNVADNEAEWQHVGKKIAEVIDVNLMRRGELNYGSSF